MKKTLIALAALAVAGTAFAQSSVSLSGAVGFGYTKDAAAKGMRMTDGNVTFAAKEDLGGGLSVTAATKLDSLTGRGNTTYANADATLTVASTNGFSVMMGSFESAADARKGDVSGISLEQGLDKTDYNLANTNVDGIVASYALMPGVSVGVAHVEYGTLGDATSATKLTKVFASYANGPLSLFASNTDFSDAALKSRSDFAASYDLGVAKVGVGHRTKGSNADSTTLFSVNVPVGAFSFGLASAEYNGLRATGYGVNYSLSKRTTLYVSKGVSDVASLDNATRVKLVHSF